mgnify:CR=1 FL=1
MCEISRGSNGTTQLRIDADNYIPRLYKLCETIHQYGAKIAIQLNHAGASALESRIGMQPVSASNLPNKECGAIQENYQLRKFIVSLMIMQPQLKELKQ